MPTPTIDELLDSLVAQGKSRDDVLSEYSTRLELRNRTDQAKLATPLPQPALAWAAREAWLHDGQPIHGELKMFAHAAYRAAKAGDQATFSRQRDLMYKAVLTFVGVPTEEVTE